MECNLQFLRLWNSSQRATPGEERGCSCNSLLPGRTADVFVVLRRNRKWRSQARPPLPFRDEKRRMFIKESHFHSPDFVENRTYSSRNMLSFPGKEGGHLPKRHRMFLRLGCFPDFLRHSTISCCNHYFVDLAANKIITETWFGAGS